VAKDVTLLIKLNDQASGKISKITNSTKQLERAANGAQNSIRRTNKGIRETGRAADRASKGVNNLGKAVRGLAAGFGVFQAGKFVIFKTAELEKQTKSLEVLTGSLGNARNIISELQQFGAVTPFTSSELIETAKRLKAFGFQTEEVVDVTKRLADVAGATGADLGGIATAFGQIQAKGRLQGEELLQLQERGVSLQDELQKMYGLTADEFRKALEGGRISADAVNLALQNITDTGGKYANGAIAQSDTLAGKFSTLVDGIERIAQKIGEKLSPALQGALSIAINLVDNINRAFAARSLTDLEKQGFKQEAEQEVMRFAGPMPGGPFGAGQVVVRHLGKTYKGSASSVVSQITNDLINREVQRRVEGARGPTVSAPKIATGQPPALLSGRGGGGGGGNGSTTTDPLASLKGQVKQLELRNALAAAGTEQERVQAQLLFDIGELTAIRTEDNAKLVDQAIKLTGKLVYQNQQNLEAKRIEDERAKQAKILNDLYQQVGNTISTAIVDSLMQAKSVTEALGGALQGIGRQLLQLGVNSLLQVAFPGSSLFSALPGFANGGRPAVGRPSIVGERGPELFVPDRAGTILPNGVGMGSTTITVNVDASETSADASSGQGAQLGKAIGLAVQQELLKQKRPGGLLAGV
jgi:tape measure domain-containing protein|tara:strand:- start:375 stop:2300 length:1926 start_codon:yes stop_codon:yes gene_type:complete